MDCLKHLGIRRFVYCVFSVLFALSCTNSERLFAQYSNWEFQSLRAEIDPAHWVSKEVQFEGMPTLVLSGDNKNYTNGSWTRTYDVVPEKYYDDFELKMKVQTKGVPTEDFLYINAGIQFRSRRIPNTNMVSGYQGDIGVSGEGNVWGSLYDESRRHRMLVMADSAIVAQALPGGIDPDGWQDYKIS